MPRSSVPAAAMQSPPDELIPPRPTGPLTFRAPSPTSSPSDLPPAETVGDSPSLADALPDELPDPSDGPRTSSKASSAGNPISKRAIRDGARQAVLGAGGIAHTVLARDDIEQEVGLYLTDQDDAEAIGDPLANIANRRGGLGAAGNPDLVDAIAALIGLALYASKQVARWQAVRAARRNASAQIAAAGLADGLAGDSPQGPVGAAQNASGGFA